MRRSIAILALAVALISTLAANSGLCPSCESTDLSLAGDDGMEVRARLYVPPSAKAPLPAVVVSHGYYANLAFMEDPWAMDLTRLGAAALFVDRRGHGLSGGSLWPTTARSDRGLELDLRPALAYLRAQPGRIDPSRIGLLGHSEGAAAALALASSEWDVRATVAVSASLAPAHLVNHMAPQNLLLIYGAGDRFILEHTDEVLIWQATRGFLRVPGAIGALQDGSARRLIRQHGLGHVDVIDDDAVRIETLRWLREALSADGTIFLASRRRSWVWVGIVALTVALASAGGSSRSDRVNGDAREMAAPLPGGPLRGILLVCAWAMGLLLAPWVATHAWTAPGEAGPIFVGWLWGGALGLGVLTSIIPRLRRRALRAWHQRDVRLLLRSCGRGAVGAAAMILALQALLTHHYTFSLNEARTLLFGVFTAAALPALCLIELALGWVTPARRRMMEAGCLAAMATATLGLSAALFDRLEVAPGVLVAAALAVLATCRCGGWSGASAAVLGAVLLGRVAAAVCPLY